MTTKKDIKIPKMFTRTPIDHGWEVAGQAIGKDKKEAEGHFRDLRPAACNGRKLILTELSRSRPYIVYEVQWNTINKYGKKIMFR